MEVNKILQGAKKVVGNKWTFFIGGVVICMLFGDKISRLSYGDEGLLLEAREHNDVEYFHGVFDDPDR